MSIKIANGYKFPRGTTFESIQKKYIELINSDFFKQVQEIWDEYYFTVFAAVVDNKDSIINYRTADEETMNTMRKILTLQDQKEDTPFDIHSSLVLFTKDGMIYCRLFCFVSEIQEMLIKHFELEDFYYYNGGDTPEYFTQDEWDFRESIWCEYEPFFIMNIINHYNYKIDFYPCLSKSRFNKHISVFSKQTRVKNILNIKKEKLLIDKLNLDKLDKTDVKYSQQFQDLCYDVRKKIRTGEYDKELLELEQDILSNLVEITYENHGLI